MKHLLPFALIAVASVAQVPAPPTNENRLLLLNKSVQDALKLTDGQKAEMKQIEENHAVEMKKFEQFGKADKETFRRALDEAIEKTTKALEMFVGDFGKDQAQHYHQIRVQVKGIFAFADESVAKSLKLTDKQKDLVKTQTEEFEKVRRELIQEAGRNPERRAEAQKKVAELNSQAIEKIAGDFSEDQKKTWKELTGEKFEWKPNPPVERK